MTNEVWRRNNNKTTQGTSSDDYTPMRLTGMCEVVNVEQGKIVCNDRDSGISGTEMAKIKAQKGWTERSEDINGVLIYNRWIKRDQ